MKKYIILTLIMTTITLLAVSNWFQVQKPKPLPPYSPKEVVELVNQKKIEPQTPKIKEKKKKEQKFEDIGLKTNTAITKIDLKDVLGGGPAKDGIPAIDKPIFDTVNTAKDWLKQNSMGILVKIGNESRFYPYDVLYWHEIVNDRMQNQNITVTFCPLCGSAVVFKAEKDTFGVSGKLWQSNLLMYDRASETLWSQITGEAVVGDRTGEKLERINSQVMEFGQVVASFAEAKVLNRQTGHKRSYGRNPYGTYEEDLDLFFPVENQDARFHPKELFIVTKTDEETVAFNRKELLDAKKAEITLKNGQKLTARVNADKTIAISDETGVSYPSYTAMWFSFAAHETENLIVWAKE